MGSFRHAQLERFARCSLPTPPTSKHVLAGTVLRPACASPTDCLRTLAHTGRIHPVAGFADCHEDSHNISRILLAAACQLRESDLAQAIVSRTRGEDTSLLPGLYCCIAALLFWLGDKAWCLSLRQSMSF